MKLHDYIVSVDGFRGQLYDPQNHGEKVIIIFMGGEGKFISAGLLAEKLAEDGFASLALYYCKGIGLPQSFNMVPLDMVEKAIAMLKRYNNNQFQKIVTYGVSMGSILALMAGVVFKDVSAVIAVSPTHIIPEGFITKKKVSGQSFLTYRGKPYNYTSIDDTLPMYKYFSKAYESDEKAEIPVENISGNILLLAGKKDCSWPASTSVDKMRLRIEAVRYHEKLHTHVYENGGHFIGIMPDMKKYKHLNLMRLMSKDELLHPKVCEKVRKQSEHDVLKFLSDC
ncbi:bile acid acyltransferase/acyl-CoA thioester hydrolase-like protein [Kineothrix alysoides]|uniref:Bile acid acyltransferase/acyl-CoA thioester hydrolase-like protein n=1 Tax=Kineothrix alysoides TaxID=1469948 RepID=A0A4R1QNX3_9FIRM|nr:acyl-CoA thioester hydrolase/BAAT C-terminal domain-containing protein [Kineothrix alysoides]TCL55489.1 bile acid acyltransferase/acyl-CoA thioester hydrolase-like protein [Kineothrix alysoides]